MCGVAVASKKYNLEEVFVSMINVIVNKNKRKRKKIEKLD